MKRCLIRNGDGMLLAAVYPRLKDNKSLILQYDVVNVKDSRWNTWLIIKSLPEHLEYISRQASANFPSLGKPFTVVSVTTFEQ